MSPPTVIWWPRNMSRNKKWKKRVYQVTSQIVVAKQIWYALHNLCSIDISLLGCGQISAFRCPFRRPGLIPFHRYGGIFFNGTQFQLFIRVIGDWTQVVKHIPSFFRDNYLRYDLTSSFFSLFITLYVLWAIKNSEWTHSNWYKFCSV